MLPYWENVFDVFFLKKNQLYITLHISIRGGWGGRFFEGGVLKGSRGGVLKVGLNYRRTKKNSHLKNVKYVKKNLLSIPFNKTKAF